MQFKENVEVRRSIPELYRRVLLEGDGKLLPLVDLFPLPFVLSAIISLFIVVDWVCLSVCLSVDT